MAERYDVLIVGGGHGGAQVAIALRQRKFEGSIAIVGDEPDYPYERPPLSKEYLAEEKGFERILIRQPDFWTERDIAVLRSRRVSAIDPLQRVVQTDNGETFGYGDLVWSAGGVPRKLSCAGGGLAGVHSVRSRADVDRMMDELRGTTNVVVIGGGYIGLEAAAVLRKLGKHVTVLEALDRVLARVAGEPLSRFFEAEHRAKGVDVRLGVRVDSLVGADGRVAGVQLEDGAILPCEMVVVGIGIIPAIDPLEAAGAETGNGVSVDRFCRTSLPHVFAIGDCALHENPFADGLLVRVESVANANDMATTVARAITGDPQPHHAVPWFWSNQYDLKLQTVGLSTGHDEAILRGDPTARSFSIVYRRGGRVIALDCVNATKDYVQGRKLVETGSTADAASLADPSVPLKSLAEEHAAAPDALT